MSFANARASFNRAIGNVADAGIPILYEPHQPWLRECYRVEWMDVAVPRDRFYEARNVRIHVQGTGTLDQELRLERLVEQLGLPRNNAGIAALPIYDYKTDPANPAAIGVLTVERSAVGATFAPATVADPTLRRIVFPLVVVYRRQ